MGIGLAIAHGLAQAIGATITVTSEANKGSSFTATVPSPSGGVTPRT
jgi:signal transduction histidine kinase